MDKTTTFFWRRLFAFTIDCAIIVGIGYILGYIFFDFFAQFGEKGHFIGFLIALLYFGLLNSVLTKGQTVGKLISLIKVTGENGEYLSVGRSILRYLIVSVAFFCDNIPTRWLSPQTELFPTILEVIAVGVGLSIFYLLIFNRKKNQSLHDIIVGSCVSSVTADYVPTVKKMHHGHYIVVILFFVVVAVLAIPSSLKNNNKFSPDDAAALRAIIEGDSEIVHLSSATRYNRNNGAKLFIEFFIHDLSSMNDIFANKIIVKIVKNYSHIDQYSNIGIYMYHGYNIGIAANWRKRPFSYYSTEKILSQIEAQGISEQGINRASGASNVDASKLAKEAFHTLEKHIYNKEISRKGLKMLNLAANVNPNEPWVYIAASLSALADGYEFGKEGYPDSGWYEAGTFWHGRLEQAIAIAERALELGPELSATHAYFGRLLIIKNKNQEALMHLDKALEIAPAGFYPLFYKGVYFEKNNKLRVFGEMRNEANIEKAQKYFERAKNVVEHKYQYSMINSHLQNIALLKRDKITQKRLLEESKLLKYKNPYAIKKPEKKRKLKTKKNNKEIPQEYDELFKAIKSKDVEKVKQILSSKSINLDPPRMAYEVNKPLGFAAAYGNLEIVKLLLEKGADINGKTAYGDSPLIKAAERKNNEIVEFLLSEGADVNQPNDFGKTVFIAWSAFGDLEHVKLALSYGAKVNEGYMGLTGEERGEMGLTALQTSAFHGKLEVIKVLLLHGGDPTIEDSNGKNAFDLATQEGHAEVVNYLKNNYKAATVVDR